MGKDMYELEPGVGTLTKPKLLKNEGYLKKKKKERRYKTNQRTRENLINRKKKREPRGEEREGNLRCWA